MQCSANRSQAVPNAESAHSWHCYLKPSSWSLNPATFSELRQGQGVYEFELELPTLEKQMQIPVVVLLVLSPWSGLQQHRKTNPKTGGRNPRSPLFSRELLRYHDHAIILKMNITNTEQARLTSSFTHTSMYIRLRSAPDWCTAACPQSAGAQCGSVQGLYQLGISFRHPR